MVCVCTIFRVNSNHSEDRRRFSEYEECMDSEGRDLEKSTTKVFIPAAVARADVVQKQK
jgi:hypothetical protein